MKKSLFLFAATVLCCIPSFGQQQEPQGGSVDMKDTPMNGSSMTQEGVRNISATTVSTRIFTYDAAGNRILMSTSARNAPASPYADLSQDEQVSLSMTTGLLRVSLSGENHKPYSISVYNIAGQLVIDRRNCRGKSQDINLSHLEKGVYIMDVCTGNNHSTKKFTKK